MAVIVEASYKVIHVNGNVKHNIVGMEVTMSVCRDGFQPQTSALDTGFVQL